MANPDEKMNTVSMPDCKICGSSSVSLAHTVGKYEYYRCSSCNTLFLHPFPKEKIMDYYYESQFEYQAGKSEEQRTRSRAQKILLTLNRLRPAGKSLLDIGSGYGFFLHEAQQKNFDVVGIEPSKALYKYSKAQSKAKLANTNLTEFLKTSKQKYDFITLIHVIEHVHDPVTTIRQIAGLLKPGGILYIETPNLDSHLYHTEKDSYTFLTPPDHLWIFSGFSLKEMIKTVKGISVIKVSTSTHPEHFMGVIKQRLFWKKNAGPMQIRRQPLTLSKKIGVRQSSINKMKYLLLDRLLAPLASPLLDINNKGSILELYIIKT